MPTTLQISINVNNTINLQGGPCHHASFFLNYNTNIFLMQNRTNDTYLRDANKVVKIKFSLWGTTVIMWFE